MVILLTIVHVVICFFLVIVVLLQSGKAADLAGAFGGMGSQTAFGPRGSATVLSKATTVAAALFMVTSMSLAIISSRGATSTGSTVLDTESTQTQQTAPAQPAPVQPPQQGTTKGKPSVTVTDPSTGESKTMPLNIPPKPGEQSSSPAQPAKQ